jgi:hypothetical protein
MADPQSTEVQPSPEAELTAYLENLPPRYARKLNFSEKCGLAYALHRGERAKVPMQAFNLSRATCSLLANALKPGRRHYPEIRQEYERLGHELFVERYYTRELNFRLKRVRDTLIAMPGGELDVAPKQTGPDPRAAKYSRAVHGVIELPDNSQWAITNDDNPWFFYSLERPGTLRGQEWLEGRDEPKIPFRTSAAAFDGLYEFTQWPNPRAKPGRPPK